MVGQIERWVGLIGWCGNQFTDDGSILRPVEGADDDETEAFVLLAVNEHVTGVQGRALRGHGHCGGARRHAVVAG